MREFLMTRRGMVATALAATVAGPALVALTRDGSAEVSVASHDCEGRAKPCGDGRCYKCRRGEVLRCPTANKPKPRCCVRDVGGPVRCRKARPGNVVGPVEPTPEPTPVDPTPVDPTPEPTPEPTPLPGIAEGEPCGGLLGACQSGLECRGAFPGADTGICTAPTAP